MPESMPAIRNVEGFRLAVMTGMGILEQNGDLPVGNLAGVLPQAFDAVGRLDVAEKLRLEDPHKLALIGRQIFAHATPAEEGAYLRARLPKTLFLP